MATDVPIIVTTRHDRQCAGSGSRWEPVVGYSRAVRAGNVIAVSGTVGVNADGTYAPSLYAQTQRALEIARAAIEALGGRIEDVIRTRLFVTDVSRWEEAARAHGAVFREVRPAATMVEVARLIDAEAQVEIEVDAVVP
jgi:enamine deaminase RidA (YjgF/YER057c/UK114 family)